VMNSLGKTLCTSQLGRLSRQFPIHDTKCKTLFVSVAPTLFDFRLPRTIDIYRIFCGCADTTRCAAKRCNTKSNHTQEHQHKHRDACVFRGFTEEEKSEYGQCNDHQRENP